MMHLTSRWWCGHKKDDIIFSLQFFIHTTSIIDNKMTWMPKISFENMTKIKITSNMTKKWLYKWHGQNDVSSHRQHGHKIILQQFKNQYQSFNMSTNIFDIIFMIDL
jgi:hypothetical protein